MSLQHRFKIGDTVRVVKGGLGIHPDHIGKIATITSLGYYTEQVVFNDYRDLGYTTYPSFGPGFSGFYSEGSFELVENKQTITHTKTKQMSKSRQVVKKVAQDVRVIETSLINKEEVFKMLALAESTGLPCLLVGAPGVNLN